MIPNPYTGHSVIPSLQTGEIVLMDRFRLSLVYGAKDPSEMPRLMELNRAIIGENFIWPDLALIFDVNVETALQRSRAKNIELDEFEKAKTLERVRQNYLAFPAVFPNSNCRIINAAGSPEEVFNTVRESITNIVAIKKF